MAEELGKMGVETTEEQDSLTIHGSESTPSGATVEGRADHRIIMSLALAGLVADGETTVQGTEHVDVSFPGSASQTVGQTANSRYIHLPFPTRIQVPCLDH